MSRLIGRRFLCALLCVFLVFAHLAGAGAEALLTADTPSAAEIAAAVDAFVDQHKDTTAAVSIGVAQGGQVLFEKAYGLADIKAGRAADMDSVYEWGSATKLLTWVSVMQLAEQGTLDLDADVRTYLPEGFLMKLKFDRPITIMNLMHHDAGFEDVLVGLFVSPGGADDDLARALKSSEPNQIYEPGSVVAYSNWGVGLAGYIVERVSGEKFWQYVHNNIFAPLKMEHTALAPDLSDNAWVKEQRALIEGYAGLTPMPNRFAIPLYPAGMATGTLPDMLTFAKALVPADGGTSPLFTKPETLETLFTPTLLYGTDEPRSCHGFWVLDFGVPLIGHGGNTAAFSSHILLHPETHTALAIMTNQANEITFNSELPEFLFGKFAPAQGGEMPDALDLRGVYQSGRVAFTGPAKLYSLMMTMPLLGGDENMLNSGSLFGLGIAFNQTAPDVFVVDEASSIKPIDMVRAARTAGGGARLQMPYFDFQRISPFEGVVTYGSVLLLMLALLYFIMALLGGGIHRLVQKLRRIKPAPCAMRKFHRLLCLLGIAEGVNMLWMAANLLTYAPRWLIAINLGFSCLTGISAVIYLVLLALPALRRGLTRWQRRLYGITGFAGLILVLNILYWQMYRF